MDNKIRFQEMLKDILEVARVQGNLLEMSEIKSLFGDLELREEQYEHVFAYLAANEVKINGYSGDFSEYTKAVRDEALRDEDNTNFDCESSEQGEGRKEAPEKEQRADSAYLKMYLEDIKAIKEGTEDEIKELAALYLKEDQWVKTKLIEANLHQVVHIASEYKNKGITMEDLIQEGNIGLICSLEAKEELRAAADANVFIREYIRNAIATAIRKQSDNRSFEEKVMDKAKYIKDSADELVEDLGREANLHELADYLKIPEDEIISILNMSADFVKIDKNHKH